jgi:hypothetical protein
MRSYPILSNFESPAATHVVLQGCFDTDRQCRLQHVVKDAPQRAFHVYLKPTKEARSPRGRACSAFAWWLSRLCLGPLVCPLAMLCSRCVRRSLSRKARPPIRQEHGMRLPVFRTRDFPNLFPLLNLPHTFVAVCLCALSLGLLIAPSYTRYFGHRACFAPSNTIALQLS